MQLKDCLRRTEKEVHRLKAVEEDKNNDIIKVQKYIVCVLPETEWAPSHTSY